jgi:hypothetical protein
LHCARLLSLKCPLRAFRRPAAPDDPAVHGGSSCRYLRDLFSPLCACFACFCREICLVCNRIMSCKMCANAHVCRRPADPGDRLLSPSSLSSSRLSLFPLRTLLSSSLLSLSLSLPPPSPCPPPSLRSAPSPSPSFPLLSIYLSLSVCLFSSRLPFFPFLPSFPLSSASFPPCLFSLVSSLPPLFPLLFLPSLSLSPPSPFPPLSLSLSLPLYYRRESLLFLPFLFSSSRQGRESVRNNSWPLRRPRSIPKFPSIVLDIVHAFSLSSIFLSLSNFRSGPRGIRRCLPHRTGVLTGVVSHALSLSSTLPFGAPFMELRRVPLRQQGNMGPQALCMLGIWVSVLI